MVYIITGEIDSGKTSRMQELYDAMKPGRADGFISRKLKRENECIGYEIVRLASGQKQILALLADVYVGEFEVTFNFQQWVFSTQGIRFGEAIIRELLGDESRPDIYIDEIGPLELRDGGFANVLRQALNGPNQLIISVRSDCRDDVLHKFRIDDSVEI